MTLVAVFTASTVLAFFMVLMRLIEDASKKEIFSLLTRKGDPYFERAVLGAARLVRKTLLAIKIGFSKFRLFLGHFFLIALSLGEKYIKRISLAVKLRMNRPRGAASFFLKNVTEHKKALK